jgi:L-ascorbate metabolism protein UlaG (beta-lactamase superfamily)
MAPVHTNPEEALEMQKKLNIKTGIGIHYGTFPLADDSQDDPIIDLELAQKKDEYKYLDFRVGKNGTTWDL